MSRSHDHSRVIAATLVVVFCCWGAPVLAQTALGGVVRDATGYIIQNAEVIVVNVATGQEWRRTTGPLGDYIVWDLPPGRYRVRMEPPPFKAEGPEVEVKWGFQTGADLMVYPTTMEAITVTSEPLPADTIATDPLTGARIFSREVLETMALSNGRTMQSVQAAVPGIVVTESTGSLAQFTAMGQRRFSNRMIIDGVSADLAVDVGPEVMIGRTDNGTAALPAFATSGGTQTLVPLAAINEIEVRTTNTLSEHARTPGAQTIIVTRAGTERVSGSVFSQARPSQLAASDWFDNNDGRPKRRVDYFGAGASVGGPLYRKRLFGFATWERQRIERPIGWTVRVPSLAAREAAAPDLRPYLDAFPLPNGPATVEDENLAHYSHLFPAVSTLSSLSVRLDASVSARHNLFIRVNRGRSNGDSLAANGTQPFFSFTNVEATSTTTGTFGWTANWGSVSHDLRVNGTEHGASLVASAASYGEIKPLPLDRLVPPGVSLDDAWVNFGLFFDDGGFLLSGRVGAGTQHQLQIADTWTVQRGRHEWKAGFEYRRGIVANRRATSGYRYQFNDVSQLLRGQVSLVKVAHSAPARARFESTGFFAQDTFRVLPRFSVNYGLRYRIQPAPVSLTETQPWLFRFDTLADQPELHPLGARLWNTSFADLGPQIAATYRFGTSERETALRVGWSLTFDEAMSAGLRAFTGFPGAWVNTIRPSTFPVVASDLQVVPPSSFLDAPVAEAISFQENLRSPRTYKWHVGVDQAIGRAQRASLAYVGAAGRQLLYRYLYYVENANHAVYAFSNDGRSDYNALLLEYVRLPTKGFEARVAYTWSHTIDVDSGDTSSPNAPPTIVPVSSNRGPADFDRPHAVRATASYRLPDIGLVRPLQSVLAGWQIDIVGTITSGAPISVTQSRFIVGPYKLRPDVVEGVPAWIDDPESATGRRINRDAFRTVTEPRQGTLGRNTLRSATLRQIDVAVSRSLRIGSQLTAQLRLEAFNVLNLQNSGPPIGDLDSADVFGRPFQSYAHALGTGTLIDGGLIPLQQIGGSRSIQMEVRLGW